MAARARRSCCAELLERGTPLLGVCLGTQLLAEAAGGEATRDRASPRSAGTRSRCTAGGAATIRCSGARAELRGTSSGTATRRCRRPGAVTLRAQRRLPAGLPDRRARLGDPVPRRGHRGRRRRAGSTDWREDEDAVRIGLDPEALRAETGRRSTPGTSSAASSAAGSSTRRASRPLLRGDVGAREAAVDEEGRGGDVGASRRSRGRARPGRSRAVSAKRPIGTWTSRRAACSGSFANSSCSSGVLTGPGQSALTRTPRRANSTPSSRESASTPPFDAV